MATVIRPELSTNNKYWISKDKYYELKHFCKQYKEWERGYNNCLNGCAPCGVKLKEVKYAGEDKVSQLAILMAEFSTKMKLVQDICKECDADLAEYLFKGVTEGLSYNCLSTLHGMPASKDMYYDRYRRFFWLLAKER